MRRPSKRLIIAAIISLFVGFAVSWAIMAFILKTELRLYGWNHLTSVAIFVAILVIM